MELSATLSKNRFTIALGACLLMGLFWIGQVNYLLFHGLVETFTIVVACGVFMFAYNTRDYLENNYLLFVGIAYVFVAGIDVVHTLAYEGMGVFPGEGANLPTQLWVAGRYLQGFSLLLAPFFLNRSVHVHRVLLVYALVTAALLASIFIWPVFPVSYVENYGLTPFKKISEILISLIMLGSIALLYSKRQEFAPSVFRLIVLSIGTAILSELAFTSYVSVYSIVNLIGHILRIVSFYLFYKAVIETGLVKPYSILLRKLKQNEEVLWHYTTELRARNEDLDAFAHTVAHDLKNPVATLLILSNTMSDTNLKLEEVQEVTGLIGDTAQHMGNIIDELMLLSEVRKADVSFTPLDMSEIVAEAQKRLSLQIREAEAQISQPGAWPCGSGYAPWVEEVWINYLSNAIKYGGRPPVIELGAEQLPDFMLRFWVRDNGPGISPEMQPDLFKPFTKMRQVHTGGQGLGLSIVQRIVSRLGGQVGVESQPGQGSLFYFTLPSAADSGYPVRSPALGNQAAL